MNPYDEFSSNYPPSSDTEDSVKMKGIVSKIKGAGKLAKSKSVPSSGVGKASQAISPGKKPKKKKRK